MRSTIINCNQTLIKSGARLDGRQEHQRRSIKIGFGPAFGSCAAAIGQSKVFSNISASISEPKISRPSEGILSIRAESTNYRDSVHLSRLIHRCLIDSRCIDLESLCIISGVKVWQLQADIYVLNNDGNVVEAASIAILGSLAHFRLADVSVDDGNVIIHPFETREPSRLTILHYPFLTKFAFFKQATISFTDPTEDEEAICDGYLIIGANVFKEITLVHVSGKSLISRDQILEHCQYAVVRAKSLSDELKKALDKDDVDRKNNLKSTIYEVLASIK